MGLPQSTVTEKIKIKRVAVGEIQSSLIKSFSFFNTLQILTLRQAQPEGQQKRKIYNEPSF